MDKVVTELQQLYELLEAYRQAECKILEQMEEILVAHGVEIPSHAREEMGMQERDELEQGLAH